MSRRKRKYKPRNTNSGKSKNEISDEKPKLKTETKYGILAIVFFVLSLFLLLALFGLGGKAGGVVYKAFKYLLGVGYILLPILFIMLGTSYLKEGRPSIGTTRLVSSLLFLFSGLGMIDIASGEHAGGLLGKIIALPLLALFDVYVSIIILGAILIIAMIVMFDQRPSFRSIWHAILKLLGLKKGEEIEEEYEESEEEEVDEEEEEVEEEEEKEVPKKGVSAKVPTIINGVEEEFSPNAKTKRPQNLSGDYVPPPLTLLETDKGKPGTGDIKANANIIKRTLQNFGIEVEMDEITIGPTVTRYALKPAEGVKLSRIVGLQNDLALALAAHPIRIEAPIPGKSLVGIEIPNKTKSVVGLGTLLADEKYRVSDKPLTVALGRSISGKAHFANLAKMPHALVAGATGAGKSVTIHAIITSLLYRNSPDDLKFIMVDPKRVELTLYRPIPHLLTPVITDAKKAILALKWAAKEMDRRYDILESESVRDIQSYHSNIYKNGKNGDGEDAPERMPYIVIIIDELADIMSSYPRELESAIVRLAQMSRAVGIHLILSTQRPEVNVITGLIKANVPARVALKVASQIDSRTILDTGGAEKLLGAGDMLYSSGNSSIERLQSAFISETEVKKVVKYLADEYRDTLNEDITIGGNDGDRETGIFESSLEDEAEDEMYEEARACIIEAGKASTSYLQRKLKLGYARAARLMDQLEERGVIGPADGAKPREVLEKIDRDEEGNNTI